MDFGFIQIAAPASQPAPLADPSASADLATDVAGAFDAALAATLGPANVGADPRVAPGGRAGQQPAWLLASVFAPTVTAFDVAAPAVTTTEDVVSAEEESIPVDVPADDEASDELVAVPVNVAVPIPCIPEIRNALVPQGGPVADGGIAVTGEQAKPAAARAQSHMPADGFERAAATGRVPGAAAAHAARTQAVPANAPVLTALPGVPVEQSVAGNAGVTPLDAGVALLNAGVAPLNAGVAPLNAGVAPLKAGVAPLKAGVAPLEAGVAPLNAGVAPMNPPVDRPFDTDALTGIATDQREMHAPVKTAVPRPELPAVAAQPTEAAQNVAATTAVANALAAVADQGAAHVTNVTGAARTEPESAAVSRLAVSLEAQSHQDAPMTGQDQHGQARQSPEFTRFAAALAQVTSAGEDGGRAASPVVAQVASTAGAAAGAAHATVAAGSAAQVSTSETPEAANVARLVQAMRVISRPGAWEATVRLRPEHLGEVSISVRVERNVVSAVVNAEAVGVRQWLESQEQAVRTGMAEHGLHLDRFVVQRDGQRRDAESQQQEPRRQSPRRQAEPTERFEVVV